MLEGRGSVSGWLVVGVAVVALVAFTGLLFVRGGTGPQTLLTGGASSPRPSSLPSGSARPSTSGLVAAGSARPSAGRPTAASSGAVAGATSSPTATPTRTARPSSTSSPTPVASQTTGSYTLPRSPQAATVALENGQGDCPNFPIGGVIAQSSFTQSSSGQLTATSPSKHRLSGRVQANGSFSLSGANPVERWVGTLTDTGGTGSYFVVSNGCTEGYETTIAFQP